MTISNFEYSQRIGEFGDRITQVSNEYAEIPHKYKLNSQEDVDALKGEWLLKVNDFRIIQKEIDNLEMPTGFEKECKQLNQAIRRYVDCIEEKTTKFGIEAMNSGELDRLQKLEFEASAEIKRITDELADKMFN